MIPINETLIAASAGSHRRATPRGTRQGGDG